MSGWWLVVAVPAGLLAGVAAGVVWNLRSYDRGYRDGYTMGARTYGGKP